MKNALLRLFTNKRMPSPIIARAVEVQYLHCANEAATKWTMADPFVTTWRANAHAWAIDCANNIKAEKVPA